MPRVIWITGASSGIGHALTEVFVGHGDTVIASARNLTKLEELKSGLASGPGVCQIRPCDVTEERQVREVGESVITEFGTVDVLINNAGVTTFKDFAATTTQEFDQVLSTNLRGLFLTTKTVLPAMLHRQAGVIINIISYAAKVTYTGSSAYSAAKAGAQAMMDVLRAETRTKGIKIVNVSPGAVLTPIWHPKVRERYGHLMMNPAEVAKAVFDLTMHPASIMIEDIIIRPQAGDLKV